MSMTMTRCGRRLACALPLALAIAAMAAPGDAGAQGRHGSHSARHGQQPQVRGEVISVKQVDIRERGRRTGRSNLVALVQTDEGRRVVVDLGPSERLRVQPRRGDRLYARGRITRIGDRRVVLADTAWFAGQQVRIDRPPAPRATTYRQTGQIVRIKDVEVIGRGRRPSMHQHRVVLLRDRQGRQLVVDLGPAHHLRAQDIRLRTGQWIQVTGRLRRIGDRTVLEASELRAGGRTAWIQRGRYRAGAG